MSIIKKLSELTLLSFGLYCGLVSAQALRPGAPPAPSNQTQATVPAATPVTAPSVATLPASNPTSAQAAASGAPVTATVTPATVQPAPVNAPPASTQGRQSEANPFIPNKPANATTQTNVQPEIAGNNPLVPGQTLASPGVIQPNFNGQFPISAGQPVGVVPTPVEPEEKVHPVIERGAYIGKVNGKPIYKAPREYYFDKPGAEVIYKPKQEISPVGEQANQPGQRAARPGQRQTNTNR